MHSGPTAPSIRAWVGLAALIIACNGLGFLSAMVVSPEQTQPFFLSLQRPSWAPPPWLFAPAWTALYTLMAIATWLVWRHTSGVARRNAMAMFGIQLALNLAWTPVFFGCHAVGPAILVIVANFAAVAATIVVYRRRVAIAGWLLVPLLLWVGFASALNIAIWRLNG